MMSLGQMKLILSFYTITIDAVKYKDSYIKQIDAQLRDGWTF